MFRSSRARASLIRSLLLGTATTAFAVSASSVLLVGCKDESQPDYWVEKLNEASWRSRSVTRLSQFFEDASSKAKGDNNDPKVQELLNKIVDPLTKTYVDKYAELDTKTRVALIKLLAAFRDKRTEPALKKAFEEFAKKPATGKDDADIKWAVRAAADLKLDSLADPLVQAFLKLRASTMLGGVTYKDFNDAMVEIKAKSWTGPLISALDAPIERPANDKERDKIDPYKDQLFWQTTAAQVLGEIAAPEAVEPMMKIMLDPAKADAQATAVLAMVKIGKPAAEAAIKLLKSEDEKMIAFHYRRLKELKQIKDEDEKKMKEKPQDAPYVQTAAIIVGTIGRGEGVAPMLEALKKAEKDVTRALIARELVKLPRSAESLTAFKEAFEKISIEANIPPGMNALQMLAEAAGQFYNAELIDWLLERADKTKGSGDDLKALQGAIVVTTIKLAKTDQLDKVKAAVDKYGTKLEKDLYAQAEKLVKQCTDKADCYLVEMEKSTNQEQATQFIGIKAGYMGAILGGETQRDELVKRIDSFENAAVRFVAAQTIDHLSPKGSKEAAAALRKVVDKNAEGGDKNKMAGDAPIKQVMYRIEARAD
jgi:HEAT repeat protein